MPSAPDDADARAAKFRVLTARFACRAASQLLVRNTWDSLWLLAFSDVGRQAVVRGNVNAATELLTFLLTPIISSFTDAHGRRSGQLFCALCNLCYHLCGLTLGLRGSVPGLIAGQFFFAIAQQGQTLQRASMGDLYMADPVMYTSALSKMELCYPCSKMSMPLLAAVIVSGGQLHRVYYLSTTLAIIDALVALLGPETLHPHERKPFQPKHANPLSFFKMFSSGRRLRRLAIVQVLGDGSDSGYGTDPPEQIANLHRSTTLGWSVPQRAQWDSVNALIRVVSSPTVSAAVARFGQVNTWTLGVVAYVSHTIPMALATRDWQIYLTLPSHALIMHRVSVERVMVAKTGVDTGFAQGELLGMSANLKTVACILSPLFWSRLYAAGVRRGKAGLWFYTGLTLVTLVRLVVMRSLAADFGPPSAAAGAAAATATDTRGSAHERKATTGKQDD